MKEYRLFREVVSWALVISFFVLLALLASQVVEDKKFTSFIETRIFE